jgi:hypothetical protein
MNETIHFSPRTVTLHDQGEKNPLTFPEKFSIIINRLRQKPRVYSEE